MIKNRISVFLLLIMMTVAGIVLFSINPELLPFRTASEVRKNLSDTIFHQSGLIGDEGLQTVLIHCTGCHSARLIAQNSASREGWVHLIRWMQETQGLWDLGENEEVILDYLSKNYAPKPYSRRRNLNEIEWYVLEQN